MKYILCFLSSFIFSLLFSLLAILIGKKLKILDYPDKRKIHTKPLPRTGGIAIFLSFLLASILAVYFFPEIKKLISYVYKLKAGKDFFEISLQKQYTGILVGSTIMFFLGLVDDIRPIRPVTKLLVQIIAAFLVMSYGVQISGIALPFTKKFIHFPLLISQIVTILWLLLFINSINFIDALDGLAAGICMIVTFCFFIISYLQTSTKVIFYKNQLLFSGFLSIIICGACFGFLFFNFHPAKIFLGDSGSLLLGFLLGSISISGLLKGTIWLALLVPVVIMAFPISDVIISIIRRILQKKHIMEPDKGHLHHLLLNLGWSQREIVLLMYTITFFLAFVSLAIMK